MRKLDSTELSALAVTLPLWTFDAGRGGTIRRDFVFPDFVHAFAFMTQVALLAERHNHHPEWSNVYNRVTVLLTTHDVEGLSTNDLALARAADGIHAALTRTQEN